MVRQHRLWREPTLPAVGASAFAYTGPEGADGVIAEYVDADGVLAIAMGVTDAITIGQTMGSLTYDHTILTIETRIIDGHPAVVIYSLVENALHGTRVTIYDETTGLAYGVDGYHPTLRGTNIDATIAIARSLFEPPNAPAAFAYTTYDPTGQATTPGSYAFLDDAGAVVTTYEGLRDGTTTGLRVHTSDAYGQSQAGVYDAVAVGDLFEWWEADDCFVRYTVTEVQADPVGTSPRKEFAVEWMTYAFTGCSGALSPTTPAILQWGPLPALGGTSLTAPVIHGIYQLVPEDWTGAAETGQLHHPPGVPPGPFMGGHQTDTRDLTEARAHPYWREPDGLPAGETFQIAVTGGYDATRSATARPTGPMASPGS